MALFVLLAFLNGGVVGTSRAVNGRLGSVIGPFRASLWNHLVGFGFLTLLLLVLGQWDFHGAAGAPLSAYAGGFIGTLFVAVSSYVFPRLGAVNAALLVISGQMISAVLLDALNQHGLPPALRSLGALVVLLGIRLTRHSGSTRAKDTADD